MAEEKKSGKNIDNIKINQKENKKGLKFNLRNLTNQQKNILAIGLTVLIVGFISFLSLSVHIKDGRFVFSMPFSSPKDKRSEQTKRKSFDINDAISKLESQISQTKPTEFVVESIRFEDLNIYPTSWVERNFTAEERRNVLISGPNADPDNDGLNNRMEYMYSSNPKNAYTLCGRNTEEKENCDKTDKENIENQISPLTGLAIQEVRNIIITRQDRIIAEELNDSMFNASESGVDFPEIYQLSASIDLTEELQKIEFSTIPDTRETLLKYMELKTEFLQEFSENGIIFSFSEIYKLIDKDALKILKDNYQNLYDNFKSTPVPKSQADFQRAVLFSLKKAIELIDIRIKILEGEIEDSQEQVEKNKQKAIELVWGFRQLNEITKKEQLAKNKK
jgi:hypothetical protein